MPELPQLSSKPAILSKKLGYLANPAIDWQAPARPSEDGRVAEAASNARLGAIGGPLRAHSRAADKSQRT